MFGDVDFILPQSTAESQLLFPELHGGATAKKSFVFRVPEACLSVTPHQYSHYGGDEVNTITPTPKASSNNMAVPFFYC